QLFWQAFRQPINQWRVETLHLPAWQRNPLGNEGWQRVSILYGYSPTVIPKPANWAEHLHVTGYWFLESLPDFSPPLELIHFLEAGEPPIYIGFDSMTDRHPEFMAETAITALTQTRQRGILLTGWGGISHTDLPDSIFKLDSVPHSWLFPKMTDIVHHGGAGTTAAALRAGVPNIIIPFIADQPFWGHRIAQLGVGPQPIPKKKLTVERLATAIQTAVEDKAMKQRAKVLGRKIRSENGVAEAVKAFHQLLPPKSSTMPVAALNP
ncbi:MAG: glycosyltransferase family 1 protein, partial [Leptolyngbya sp. SIO1D8]|nr:glycosyltransferase family 1 protein [Leptolyngbya sp. SIO1D8]